MTAIELKTAITKVLENLPEEALENVLTLVKEQLKKSEDKARRDRNFEKIIADNRELLQKLAQ